ncbi:MAG TPA: BTAD domain-containing putative transcriptional regulator [Pseudonocardiaceae bacterium]
MSGTKQRATLAFLLLHLNSVVATSKLLRALWSADMPNTGRKMLQNAVSGIRGILSEVADGSNSPILLTHAPGYLLRVDPKSVDLSQFRDLVSAGRADLAAGSWQQASCTLREALGLWRGPVLADLVEHGITWPELTAVRNSRLAALEDCVEAEFASGHYGEVINELEEWAVAEPSRERLCGQLMRALYHCGRQADALGVYRQTRARLREDLGLDPSRELQDLERAILNQELPSSIPGSAVTLSAPVQRANVGGAGEDTWSPIEDDIRTERAETNRLEPCSPDSAYRWPEQAVAELKRVTLVLVMTRFDRDVGEAAPEHVEAVLRRIASGIREEVEEAGGVVEGKVASLWLAMFGSVRSCEDDAARSVQAAIAIRDRLTAPDASLSWPAALTVTVALATGDALVHPQEGEHVVPSVTGGVLDRGMRLLAHVSPGEVRVCNETRATTEPVIGYDGEHDPVRGSRALATRARRAEPQLSAPFVNRHGELGMLFSVLEQVSRRSRPHLVTVLGEAGMGKSRLVIEFERAVAGGPVPARCLVGRNPRFGRRGPLPALMDSLKPCLGIADGDPAELAREKLGAAVHRLVGVGIRATWMLSHLCVLFGIDSDQIDELIPHESFIACRQFLEELGGSFPLVLILEDLHCADDRLIDFVDRITEEAGSFPLLVIVTARPELLYRRPSWGGGKAGANTITLDPLSDDDATELLAQLCARTSTPLSGRMDIPDGIRAEFQAVISLIGGNPLFTVEYARMLRDQGVARSWRFHGGTGETAADADGACLPLLPLVRRVIAAMIDSLPPDSKSVLLDAAVLGENVCAAGVAAVGGVSVTDVRIGLEHLGRRELLLRTGPSTAYADYTFRYPLIRDVAYLTIPQSVRVDKHHRAAEWLERLPARDSRLLAFHRGRAAGTHRTVPPQASPVPVRSGLATAQSGSTKLPPFGGGSGHLREPRRCSGMGDEAARERTSSAHFSWG